MVAVIIAVVVVVLLVAIVVGSFNGIVRLRNQVDNGWSQIDVQIKRRADLIPNLVETVKGYAAHESGTFEAVTKAYARQFYNDSVTKYHDKIETFPGVLVAKLGSFPRRELFEADDTDRAVPKVEF